MVEDGVVVSGCSVLIVDDDVIICRCVERALKPAYRVSSATSGKEALDRIVAGERFDVIVLDLMMPDMGGVQFLDELAAVAPDQLEAVILMTGGAFTPDSIAFVATTAMTVIESHSTWPPSSPSPPTTYGVVDFKTRLGTVGSFDVTEGGWRSSLYSRIVPRSEHETHVTALHAAHPARELTEPVLQWWRLHQHHRTGAPTATLRREPFSLALGLHIHTVPARQEPLGGCLPQEQWLPSVGPPTSNPAASCCTTQTATTLIQRLLVSAIPSKAIEKPTSSA